MPLDPIYPSERMLEDAQIPILVTQQHLVAHLSTRPTRLLCLDTDEPLLLEQSQDALPATTTGDDLAYVISTSGATGQPKGCRFLTGGCRTSTAGIGRPLP